jgi:hypothetical protein
MREIIKRNWQYVLLFLVGVILFELITNQYDQGEKPIEGLIEFYSTDQELIDSIGKITSWEYTFNENDKKNDTLNFQILLYSKRYLVKINGELIGSESSRSYNSENINVKVEPKN